jgi:hypothetical protein
MNLKKSLTQALFSLLAAMALLMPLPSTAQVDQTGQWSNLNTLPWFPIHIHLLPTGKVMMWPGDGGRSGDDPRLWDPATQALTTLTKPGYDAFCTGHAFMADGRLFVAGGHISSGTGLAQASLYNPFNDTWTQAPAMNAGRWYPTVTQLGNGDALVTSGDIDTGVGVNPLPQVYQSATGTWRDLTNAQRKQFLYPFMFLAPDGRVFDVGPSDQTHVLDPTGTGQWSFVGYNASLKFRTYGSAVMYSDGKILALGGSDPPVNSAEVLDLNQASPVWRSVAPMQYARRHATATLLPDGKVLVTGGTSGEGFNNTTTPVLPAEIWDPETEQWTTLASASSPRIYHSAALLLPDGRVLATGGNGYPTPEAFSPPYLFKGTRPTISGVPTNIAYGQQFTVQTPDASSITKVTLIRLGSMTHAINANQRLSVLNYTVSGDALNITAPAHGNIAPPGHYMLFIVNSNGVPSVASIVNIAPASLSVLSSITPSSAVAGGTGFTLTANGSNFQSGAAVRWNGADRTTTFVSSTQLAASIPSTDIATSGTAQVTAANPGAAASNALTFTITAPASSSPVLSSITPSSAVAGGTGFTLTANGSNFQSDATVRWNGADRTTTFVSSTQLAASIPSTDIATSGTAQVTAANPGATASNALTFTITAPPATAGYTLSVTKNGTAASRGTVTSSPSGINCGDVCSASFTSGAAVTLEAKPHKRVIFAGWSGACTGTGTCSLTMDANKSVTATFNKR